MYLQRHSKQFIILNFKSSESLDKHKQQSHTHTHTHTHTNTLTSKEVRGVPNWKNYNDQAFSRLSDLRISWHHGDPIKDNL